jgi:hypothetical protein
MFQDDFDAVFNMLRGDLKCFPPAPCQIEQASLRIDAAQKLKPMVGVKVGRPRFLKAWVSDGSTNGFQQVTLFDSLSNTGSNWWAIVPGLQKLNMTAVSYLHWCVTRYAYMI